MDLLNFDMSKNKIKKKRRLQNVLLCLIIKQQNFYTVITNLFHVGKFLLLSKIQYHKVSFT